LLTYLPRYQTSLKLETVFADERTYVWTDIERGFIRSSRIQYDTIEEFNLDSKVECGQLNLAHVVRKKDTKKKTPKQTPNAGVDLKHVI